MLESEQCEEGKPGYILTRGIDSKNATSLAQIYLPYLGLADIIIIDHFHMGVNLNTHGIIGYQPYHLTEWKRKVVFKRRLTPLFNAPKAC